MRDDACVRFLQEVLPRLGLRWAGFRKVRAQVCKRLRRRIGDLGLPNLDAYRDHLAVAPAEWTLLDSFLRITISRFYRDRGIFEDLAVTVLPELHRLARRAGAGRLRAWSAGCASGEEPYSFVLLDYFRSAEKNRLPLEITATDLDSVLLDRARAACYEAGSLRELPRPWLESAFRRRGDQYCLEPRFKKDVVFLRQDIRKEAPAGPFHLVACRNLAFTYFDEPLQREVLSRIAGATAPGGFLILGGRESLPAGQRIFMMKLRGIYRKQA